MGWGENEERRRNIKMEYYLFTFVSTHGAIASKQYLGEQMEIRIMPTLREISNSCGISIRVKPENFEKAKELMEQGSVHDYKIYHVSGKKVEEWN